MPDETRHESADLEDYEVQDASDTLDGDPGDDPLDRGVIAPQRWSAAIRFGTTAAEQEAGESLDQLLAEEEPDIAPDVDDDRPEDIAGDEDAGDEDVDGLLLDDGRIRGRAGWWPRTREPIPPTRPILSRMTPGSTAVRRPRRRRPSTWWTTTITTSAQATDRVTGPP